MKLTIRLFVVSVFCTVVGLARTTLAQDPSVRTYFGLGPILDAALAPDRSELAVLTTRALVIYPQADPNQEPIYYEFTVDLYGRYTGSAFVGIGTIEYTSAGWIVTIPELDDRPPVALAIDRATGAQTIVAPRADGMRLHSTAGRYNLLIPVDSRTVGMVLENTDTGVMTTILPLTSPALALGYGLNHDGTRVMAAYRTVDSPVVLRIWDTASGAQVHELALERQRGTAVAFDNLIAIDQGEGIRLVSFDDGSLNESIALEGTLLPSTGGLVTEQQIGDVNRLTALIADDTGRRVLTVDMPACRTLRTLAFILDDVLVVVRGGAGGTVSRYALESGALMSAAGGFGLFAVDLAWDRQGRLLSAQGGVSPHACDVSNPGNGIAAYTPENPAAVDFLPTGSPPFEMAAAGDWIAISRLSQTIDLYRDGQRVVSLSDPNWPAYPYDLALSDSHLAALTGEGVQVWSLEALDVSMRFSLPAASSYWGQVLQFTGDVLVAAGPQSVQFIDVEMGQVMNTLALDAVVNDIQVIDGRLAVVTMPVPGSARVQFFELSGTTVTPVAVVDLERDYRAGAFSPDGRLFAVSQPNGDYLLPGTVVIDVATGAVVRSVDRMTLPVIFSPDGKHLIGADGVILVSVEV